MSVRCWGSFRGHPFLDGNKRTGAALLGTYLRMCGVGFAPDHAEFLSAMLGVADGSMSYEELVDWGKDQRGVIAFGCCVGDSVVEDSVE